MTFCMNVSRFMNLAAIFSLDLESQSRGAGTDLPKGIVWKKFKKAAVKSVHCKSQTAPIGNQSLVILKI